MSRWEPNARERLERAALELFAEQGFAATTVPQIAERAGVTTRTYFRHFADKREVLFAGDDEMPAMVADLLAAAPASLAPMELIEFSLERVAEVRFEGQLNYLTARRPIVQSDEGLRERELRKLADLTEAVRAGFLASGADDLSATISAHLTCTVFTTSVNRWIDEAGKTPLVDLLRETLATVRAVTALSS